MHKPLIIRLNNLADEVGGEFKSLQRHQTLMCTVCRRLSGRASAIKVSRYTEEVSKLDPSLKQIVCHCLVSLLRGAGWQSMVNE